MAWAKNGTPHTLTSAEDTLTISNLTAKKFNVFLFHTLATGGTQIGLIHLQGDTGNNYSNRENNNGGSDVPNINDPQLQLAGYGADSNSNFAIVYCVNISGQEKLAIGFTLSANTAGAGYIPNRREWVGKWVTTAGQFTQIDANNVGTGDFAIGSNLSALGTTGDEVLYTIQNGTIFEETDTNKSYIFNSSTSTWTQI